MLERVFTAVQYGISYRFRTSANELPETGANPAEILLERRLYFENNRAALAFLRPFSNNPFAVAGLENLLAGLGFPKRFDEQRDQWMERLALALVTGRVTVIEAVPKAPAGEAAEIKGAPVIATPPPRRKPVEPAPEPQEPATFSLDADEEAQIQTLVEAAQSGTPFCEACARAAAAARAQQQGQSNIHNA